VGTLECDGVNVLLRAQPRGVVRSTPIAFSPVQVTSETIEVLGFGTEIVVHRNTVGR
jgi:hypothetical protein